MDRTVLKLMPLLMQAAGVMSQRGFNVSMKTWQAQMGFARAMLPFPSERQTADAPAANPLLDQIDRTRAHLRHIADIVSQETRGLDADLAALADRARSLAEQEQAGQAYRRHWRAKA